MDKPLASHVSRRDLLKLGGAAIAAGAAGSGLQLFDPGKAEAQTPKRGGTFRLRIHVAPVHFDPQQTVAFPTMMALSFTHSRLVKIKAGSSVKPGTSVKRTHTGFPMAASRSAKRSVGARSRPVTER